MIRIGNTLVSVDLLEKKFICDLSCCKGSCCRYGESGAPLTDDEVRELEKIWPIVKERVSDAGIESILKAGISVIDSDGDKVTPLIEGKECAYAIVENGIYSCAIEKSWNAGEIKFRKPLSCHLFPVRIKALPDYISVNYEEISICEPGRKLGAKEGLPAYTFLRDALERRFGKPWYKELVHIAREWDKHGGK